MRLFSLLCVLCLGMSAFGGGSVAQDWQDPATPNPLGPKVPPELEHYAEHWPTA
jgi:hypothetical protein